MGLLTNIERYYRFENGSGTTLTDVSGNARHGTLTNSPTWATGKLGGGITFDGSNDYVSAPAVTTLGSAASCFLWVKRNGAQTTEDTIVHAHGGSNYGPFFFRFSSSTAVEVSVSTATSYYICSIGTIPDATWTHIGFTYNGETTIPYLNGVAGTPDTNPSGALVSNGTGLLLGCFDSIIRFFDGSIDELGIWSVVLTPKQILGLVAGGAGRSYGNFATAAVTL